MGAEPLHLVGATLVAGPPLDHEAELEFATKSFLSRYRNAQTRYSYELALRQWFGWCGEQRIPIDPLQAKRVHVELFARELEATGRMQSTVSIKLNALAGFYKFAHADELIDKDPMVHVMRPKVQRESTTNGLTRTEFADVLNAAEQSSPQDHALICVLGLNGLRVGEAISIDLEHFGRYKGQTTVTIVRKGGNTQEIPFAYRTAWAIEQLVGKRTSGPLFVARSGNRLDRAGAGRVVKRIVRSCGIGKRISPHSLRHTFVTLSRDAGIPDRDIIASTGHADVRMCEYYDRHRNKVERNATHGLASFVERAT